MFNSLNQDSKQRICNIENGLRNHPTYAAYNIKNYCYDANSGVQALEISKNGKFLNLWLFFPDLNGKIESIALYGSSLQGHYNTMRRTMMVFGMRITSISMETGNADYLDIDVDYLGESLATNKEIYLTLSKSVNRNIASEVTNIDSADFVFGIIDKN